jgi:hypothetical protein
LKPLQSPSSPIGRGTWPRTSTVRVRISGGGRCDRCKSGSVRRDAVPHIRASNSLVAERYTRGSQKPLACEGLWVRIPPGRRGCGVNGQALLATNQPVRVRIPASPLNTAVAQRKSTPPLRVRLDVRIVSVVQLLVGLTVRHEALTLADLGSNPGRAAL